MIFRLVVSAFLLLLAVQDAMASKRVALVIANGDYVDLPKLGKVLNDARPLRETLTTDLGFEVIYGENLSRRAMNRKINELDAQVERDDIVFIYYAGHGVALGGENYMLPIDLQKPEPGEEKFVTGDSFGTGALIKKIQSKGARATFVVLDACRNNPFTGPDKPAIGPVKGLNGIAVPKGVFFLLSAGPGQASLDTVSDGDQNQNSLFIRNLIPLLKTPGLSQADLAKKLQTEVSTAARAVGAEQTPAYIDQFPELITLNGNDGEIIVEGKAPTEDQTLVIEEWKIVKDSGSRQALEGFKIKYGSDPVWGPLVEQALKNLSTGQTQPSESIETKPAYSEDTENKPLYRDLQTELRRLGCYSGTIDGVWGATSQRALSKFGERKNISVRASVDTLEMLIGQEPGVCSVAIEAPQPKKVYVTPVPKQKRVTAATKLRRYIKSKKLTTRTQSSIACWICTTYSYDTQRVCLPRRIGNPGQVIPPYIRCFRK